MLVLRAGQLTAIRGDLEAQDVEALTEDIYLALCDQAPDVASSHDRSAAVDIIADTVRDCRSRGIVDEDQVLNICLIRLALDADFLAMDAFSYVLQNELMHPYAKARHLILSFFSVNNMSRGT